MKSKKIVIVGGGFAGTRCALELSRKNLDADITLISDTPHFEYHAALYRVVTGRSPLEVCIQLSDIFKKSRVKLVTDKITKLDNKNKQIISENDHKYKYDILVLALGSETSYFDTPGLKELSFGFKSIPEALKLKRHLHEEMSRCEILTKNNKPCSTHIVIVGGGASGTELAGELAVYIRSLAIQHGLDPTHATIELIQSPNRLLPKLPKDMSAKVETQLRKLGVNIFLNRRVVKEDISDVFLKDMQMKTKTVVWTAGVVINEFFTNNKDFKLSKRKKVLVNKYLKAKGVRNVHVLGDCAETPYTGMAQTAVYDGKFLAENIARKIKGSKSKKYIPRPVAYSIPVGPGWAATFWKGMKIYGKLGWFMRRLIDFKFFLSILPLNKAVLAFRSGETVCESCGICDLDVIPTTSKTQQLGGI